MASLVLTPQCSLMPTPPKGPTTQDIPGELTGPREVNLPQKAHMHTPKKLETY